MVESSRSFTQVCAAPGAADSLVEGLAEEMAEAWRQGQRPLVETFLARHAELASSTEAVLRLVYEEICLRQEWEAGPSALDILRRFPRWQTEIEALLACQSVLGPSDPVRFPAVGEALGEFRIRTELGRGGAGRVYLATQPRLADRPVVLKLTSCVGAEHLSLARLLHTHIVPLYLVEDFPDRNLRALCMPYLGGTSLASLLAAVPLAERTSQRLLDELDRATARAGVAAPRAEAARKWLTRTSYVQAVCRIGACLADALHYAHERSLLHLDIKPSNVLLTADGQPMLLDFHLAREPIEAHGLAPDWLGGTLGYMSPEQEAALAAVRNNLPIEQAVDGRSDLYSLGVLLHEALSGELPDVRAPGGLCRKCPHVSVGLADILRKCLAPRPEERYADAAGLAGDLRRHLTDQPLREAPNRSLTERWRKWRRRSPHALGRGVLLALALTALLALGGLALFHADGRLREDERALTRGRELLTENRFVEAEEVLKHEPGLEAWLPSGARLAEALVAERRHAAGLREEQGQRAERERLAGELARLVDELRFFWDLDTLSADQARASAARCARLWSARAELLEIGPGGAIGERVREDLFDLALLWAGLRARAPAGRGPALAILDEAEALFGTSPALNYERHLLRNDAIAGPGPEPRTPWEQYRLGRALLRAGLTEQAMTRFESAVAGQPNGYWPNFYQGVCAYRLGHYDEAVSAFRVCISLAPNTAAGYHNRALALADLERLGEALRDYDRALELDEGLAPAWVNRGLLHHRLGQPEQALADLRQALALGADPGVTHYNLALVEQARGDLVAARAEARQALAHRPDHAGARALLRKLAP